MSTVTTILDGNNRFGINIAIVKPSLEPLTLYEPEKLNEHVGFGYVIEGELSADTESRSERFPQHTTCVFGGEMGYCVRGCRHCPTCFLSLTVSHMNVLGLLDNEKITLNRKAKCLLRKKPEPFLYAAPASVTAQLLSGQILSCPFKGPMRQTYLELKGMELTLEYLSLYFVQNECCCEACALHSKVARAWQMMRDNLEQPFSISQLAKSVGMSESSLKRTFRSMYGASIFSSFQRHRMSEARKLLEESKYNVAEVAYRVGYANPSHFSRAFSRYFGVPPKECR